MQRGARTSGAPIPFGPFSIRRALLAKATVLVQNTGAG